MGDSKTTTNPSTSTTNNTLEAFFKNEKISIENTERITQYTGLLNYLNNLNSAYSENKNGSYGLTGLIGEKYYNSDSDVFFNDDDIENLEIVFEYNYYYKEAGADKTEENYRAKTNRLKGMPIADFKFFNHVEKNFLYEIGGGGNPVGYYTGKRLSGGTMVMYNSTKSPILELFAMANMGRDSENVKILSKMLEAKKTGYAGIVKRRVAFGDGKYELFMGDLPLINIYLMPKESYYNNENIRFYGMKFTNVTFDESSYQMGDGGVGGAYSMKFYCDGMGFVDKDFKTSGTKAKEVDNITSESETKYITYNYIDEKIKSISGLRELKRTGHNCNILLNGIVLDLVAVLGVKEEKSGSVPIFPYNSTSFTDVTKGKHIVSGFLTVYDDAYSSFASAFNTPLKDTETQEMINDYIKSKAINIEYMDYIIKNGMTNGTKILTDTEKDELKKDISDRNKSILKEVDRLTKKSEKVELTWFNNYSQEMSIVTLDENFEVSEMFKNVNFVKKEKTLNTDGIVASTYSFFANL